MRKTRNSSYVLFISAMLIFGTIGIFRRYLPLSSGLLACARGFLGAAVIGVFLKCTGRKPELAMGRKKLAMLVLSGICMGINWILLFEAFVYTDVATATLCYYMQPTILILLSPLLFREKLTGRKALCAAVSVTGMVCVSGILDGGSGGADNARGIACGLGAAAFYASVIILNKKNPVADAYAKTMVQLLSAAIVLLPYLLLTGELRAVELTPFSAAMLLTVGIFHTGFAYVLYFGSLQAIPAQSAAVLSYIDPVSALFLSALLLGERLSFFGILGAVLILGAALVSELPEKQKV